MNVAATRTSGALTPENSPSFLKSDALSPDERYMFNFFAGFDLTPHAQIYGSALLTRRDSSQLLVDQFFVVVVNPGNVFNPGFGAPIPIIPQNFLSTQQVDYGRFTLGIKGDFPDYGFFKHWAYDVYGEFSQSHAYYTENFPLADRVSAIMLFGSTASGCDVNNSEPFSNESMAQPGAMASPCVPG